MNATEQELLHPEFTPPTVEWVLVDPGQAMEWLGLNDGNRNLRARVVSAYARDMAAGSWMITGETIKFSKTGELLDGQHRLNAIIDSGLPQWLLVVKDLEPETKALIDTGAPRTGGDALRLVGIGGSNPMATAAAARLLVLWRGGRLTHMTGGMRHDDRATHQELINMVNAEPDLVDQVNQADRDMKRSGIPAGPGGMMRTVLYALDAKDAEKFFESLAGYSTEGQNDPRAVLLYTIRQMRALGQMRKPGEAVGLTFTAWNAWRDGQKLQSLTTRNAKGQALPIPEPM